jgi:hypothetical protein
LIFFPVTLKNIDPSIVENTLRDYSVCICGLFIILPLHPAISACGTAVANWCGVVWCGVVWCGVVWWGVVGWGGGEGGGVGMGEGGKMEISWSSYS